MGTHFTTNWVICLAEDLKQNANAIYQKHVMGKQGATAANLYPRIPELKLYETSRITILGHGDPGSNVITGKHGKWVAKECAKTIKSWLEKKKVVKVKRISFHMCYGGKGTGEKSTIYDSFVHNFASYCDFADEIIGRTGLVRMSVTSDKETKIIRKIERLVDDRAKGQFDKVRWYPTGGKLSLPNPPKFGGYPNA